MKHYIIAASLILSSTGFANTPETPVNPAPAPVIIVEGNYDCYGMEADTNTPFKCQMTVKKTGQTYDSTTTCDDGTSYNSTGIYQANKHLLSLVSVNPKNAEEIGVAAVDVNDDGSLESVWTYLHKTTVGHTNCTKQKNK